jgi:hypothetical protein
MIGRRRCEFESAARVDGVRSRPDAIARVVVLEEALRIILRTDLENKALATFDDDTGRANLDVHGNDLAGTQLLQLVVVMERTPGSRPRWIELAVRRAQPAVRHRNPAAAGHRSRESDLAAVASELADDGKEIRIVTAG